MAIVALVGLGFGVAFEAVNHVRRDRLLSLQAKRHQEAIVHYKRALECNLAEARALPYIPAERVKLLLGDRVPMTIPSLGFKSWQSEYENHLYWGERTHAMAEGDAEQVGRLEARLLFP